MPHGRSNGEEARRTGARCSSRLVDLLLAQKPYFDKLALSLAQSICGRVSCTKSLPGISGIHPAGPVFAEGLALWRQLFRVVESPVGSSCHRLEVVASLVNEMTISAGSLSQGRWLGGSLSWTREMSARGVRLSRGRPLSLQLSRHNVRPQARLSCGKYGHEIMLRAPSNG